MSLEGCWVREWDRAAVLAILWLGRMDGETSSGAHVAEINGKSSKPEVESSNIYPRAPIPGPNYSNCASHTGQCLNGHCNTVNLYPGHDALPGIFPDVTGMEMDACGNQYMRLTVEGIMIGNERCVLTGDWWSHWKEGFQEMSSAMSLITMT